MADKHGDDGQKGDEAALYRPPLRVGRQAEHLKQIWTKQKPKILIFSENYFNHVNFKKLILQYTVRTVLADIAVFD